MQKLWNLCDHYQPVLDNSSSDRVPGVEAPGKLSGAGNLVKIRIGRKKDTEVSQVKLQDYDHMQGGEKDNPAPDQRKQ